MQPEFGCDIWRVLFEPMDDTNIENRIETTIIFYIVFISTLSNLTSSQKVIHKCWIPIHTTN